MATSYPKFLCLWRDEGIRSILLSNVDTATLCSLRLTNTECNELTTQNLFARTRMTFTPSALTRPSRLEALSRIGPYIQHLTFSMPHTDSTFLPPLLNPKTGREVNFLYTPHTSTTSVINRPKYGSPALGDVLTQQYPPIFHAATNVPAFINAFSHMTNLRHLTISCPGQDPTQRYRRDAVDYALISLRIAIERAPLYHLEKLSLHQMHPAGLVYLRHVHGFGCTPSAGQRWKQVRKLNITMDSWDFLGPQPGLDHLKVLDDYIRTFSPRLEKVSFGWNGRKGPCPFTLFSDSLLKPPRQTSKLFGEVTSPMSPLPAAPPRAAMHFPKLRYMQVRNATMTSDQVADFIQGHQETVREFDFENVFLINGGNWDDALSPLRETSGDEWSSQQSGSESGYSSYPSEDDIEQFSDVEVVDSTPDLFLYPTEEVPRSSVLVKKQKKGHRRRRRKHREKKPDTLKISSPILEAKVSVIDLLQPTVFSPLQPTVFDPNLQGVQRNVQQEAAQQELADDAEMRVSTLKKAKEAVLKQLGREFSRSTGRKEQFKGLFKTSCSGAGRKGNTFMHQSNTALVPLMFSRC